MPTSGEHALAPGVDRIVGFDEREWARDAAPQESAGQRIIRVGGLFAAQERLLLQHTSRRLQYGAEGGHAFLARIGLERREVGRAQALSARLLEIGLIDRPNAIVE